MMLGCSTGCILRLRTVVCKEYYLGFGNEVIGLNCRTGLPNGEARTHD